MKKILVSLLYCLISKWIFSQEFLPQENFVQVLNLKKSIELSLKLNPQIQEKILQEKIDIKKIQQEKSKYYPKLDSVYGYEKNYIKNFEETPLESKKYYWGLEISQNIYDSGRTSDTIKILNKYKEISQLSVEEIKEEIIMNVILNYVDVLVQKENIKFAEEIKNYYLKYKDFIKKQIEVGLKTNYELYKIETEYRNKEVESIQYKNQYELSKLKLFYYIGWLYNENNQNLQKNYLENVEIQEINPENWDIIFNIDKIKNYKDLSNLNIEEIYKISLIKRKDYKKQLKQLEISKLNRALYRNDYYPNFGATFQYYINDQNYLLKNIDKRNWVLNIFVRFPIFEGFLTKNKIEESEIVIQQLEESEKNLKNNIYVELQQLLLEIMELEKKIEYYKENLQFTKQNLNLSEKRYINGIGNILELMDATNLYYDANRNYYYALFLNFLKKIELYKKSGLLLEIL